MPLEDPKISATRAVIRALPDGAINRIAAGEVVERPASAVKELVENAIDAGASRIEIEVAGGGKTLIRVVDNGCGISRDELPLALARHATSKIDGSDLLNIHTFGFRGEALASLAAVARLTLTSRTDDSPGARIAAEAGRIGPAAPAAARPGTVVEVRDLFFATPARLKFLRTDRAEAQAVADTVKRLAMAEPAVAFSVRDVSGGGAGRMTFRAAAETGSPAEALQGRLRAILGPGFTENAIPIDATREGLRLTGLAALPTYSRGAAVAQFLFVNGRPVRDRMLTGALRAAYSDLLSRDRHAAAALFIDCDPELVDVNVHPAKSEVRFRDPGLARGLLVSGLRHALAEAGHRASSTLVGAAMGAFRPSAGDVRPGVYQMDRPRSSVGAAPGFFEPRETFSAANLAEETGPEVQDGPLGAAKAQLHENYIVAQTADGIVIVDQHAAHERLVYEKLKRLTAGTGVPAQALLVPEIVDLSEDDAHAILSVAPDLAKLGLEIEPFGPGAVAVRATPAPLGDVDAGSLVCDLVDELADGGAPDGLGARIDAVLSRIACHGSVRSGRRMSAPEMNALLREMEATPHSGQCNHGRPTHVALKLSDIERLFGRR